MSVEPDIDELWYHQMGLAEGITHLIEDEFLGDDGWWRKMQINGIESPGCCVHCEGYPEYKQGATVCEACREHTLALTWSEATYLKETLAANTIAEPAFRQMCVRCHDSWEVYPEDEDGRRLVHNIYLSDDQVQMLYYRACRAAKRGSIRNEQAERVRDELQALMNRLQG
ncbi:hypothetical protein E6P09_02985 [Haloferax mediterranei ATCC 33500]|uniref:Uncharacterized protein n=1 Tax=Haloferax mediterranei (strain ATCC 33500 / DSM 1411 / JCM 8866 / NBRC 14739 / NCIMB 2177 / R-4) TaxID=523841 RepID=M0J262_HALMT|nr:hypothetical protein [Haloferax mediterranei]AHZ22844.1 hypothetical protein BM92_09415 [Haloferax mediterranei ATCC 33500]EMA03006.1 hypothetical protein C439_10495 [Haloferax mediterranei ATCC 33500]MDX5987812.1 hypothetical protein [Haloferax mediterranei ATCC 33500]QCQ74289.1 hypothetical protein E6P09_02985 [Haloferax mediterranei ATCC 33500]